ncbi:MAG: hypothetical protein AABY22_31940 [Nanoarchaeota archaeon]
MIKLEDITFESHFVGPTEDYPEGKSGCEMTAWCCVPKDNKEIVYGEHDFANETLTEAFKERALEKINKEWTKYENRFTDESASGPKIKVKEFLNKNGKE